MKTRGRPKGTIRTRVFYRRIPDNEELVSFLDLEITKEVNRMLAEKHAQAIVQAEYSKLNIS